MAIVDDYAAIAAELRRLKIERHPEAATEAPPQPDRTIPTPHRMRATIAGDLLYRRLVAQRRR